MKKTKEKFKIGKWGEWVYYDWEKVSKMFPTLHDLSRGLNWHYEGFKIYITDNKGLTKEI